MGGPTGFVLGEMQRQQANQLRWGNVIEVDHTNNRCRIETAGVETDWLPWPANNAGSTTSWDPIEVGEQVMLASPMGELSKAAVIGRFQSSQNPAPTNSPHLRGRLYKDGSAIYYDEENSELIAKLVATQLTATREEVSVVRNQASLVVTSEAIIGQVGGASASVADGEITFAVGGHVLMLNESGLWHNGKNIGFPHTHSGVAPGVGTTGAVT